MKPSVLIVHSMPGRVRVRLSHGLKDPSRTSTSILEHAGLTSLKYTPVTRSVLVRYAPHSIGPEEIVLRIALHLSLDYGFSPVRLLRNDRRPALAYSVVYSGVALAVAYLHRLLVPATTRLGLLDWAAGLATAGAVVNHAVTELEQRGNFDPEVLSLAYLLTSLVHGNFLKASGVTWFMAFGRHLLETPSTGVQVQAVQRSGNGPREPGYEVVVTHDADAPRQARLFTALHELLRHGTASEGESRGNLFEELKAVSNIHGQVLEGFGRMRRGIRMRFE